MKLAVIGTGYVGLVTGTCFAEMGNDVICVDNDKRKIDMLNNGKIPIWEPGLEEMVKRNKAEGRISFTTDIKDAVEKSLICFIAVGTPPDEDGSADLQYVLAVAKDIATYMNDYKIVIDKSTVPIGTACAEIMRELYTPFARTRDKVIVMSVRSAEMTKYAANAMLATKISFMNDIARLCELVGADVHEVRQGIGSDSRIGYKFIYPGIGYGGSCFPKDVKALVKIAEKVGMKARVLQSVEDVNEDQKMLLAKKVIKHFGEDLTGKIFAMWGLAFKPKTDDMREAPSRTIINMLIEKGAKIVAYDPVAIEEAKRIFGDNPNIEYADGNYEALRNADALLLVTEWNQFRNPDFNAVKERLKQPVLFDGRNQYDPQSLRDMGFVYYSIGRK